MGSFHNSENHSLLSGGGFYKDDKNSLAQVRRTYSKNMKLGQIQELDYEGDFNVQKRNQSNQISGGVIYRDANGNIMTEEQVKGLNRQQSGMNRQNSQGKEIGIRNQSNGRLSGQNQIVNSVQINGYKKLSDYPNANIVNTQSNTNKVTIINKKSISGVNGNTSPSRVITTTKRQISPSNTVNKSQEYQNLLLSNNQPGKISGRVSGRVSGNHSQIINNTISRGKSPEKGANGIIRNKTTSEIIYQNSIMDQRVNKPRFEESLNLHPVFQNNPNEINNENLNKKVKKSPIINSQYISNEQATRITSGKSRSPNKRTIIRQNRVIPKEVQIKTPTQPSPQPRRIVQAYNQNNSMSPIQARNHQIINREIKQKGQSPRVQYVQNIQQKVNNNGQKPQVQTNRIYQSQQITNYPGNRFRQNSNRFENVINRSAAFTFNTGSFKTGKTNQPITRIQTNMIKKKTENGSKSPNKLFNSSVKMRPRKPTKLLDDDHVKIDEFIFIQNKKQRGRRLTHEIHLISENINRSRTPKKKGPARVIQKSIPRKRIETEVKSRSPIPSGLPIIQKDAKRKKSVKVNKKIIHKQVKSNRNVNVQRPVRSPSPNQNHRVITEHRKKCKN
jgi:hypothetical protein